MSPVKNRHVVIGTDRFKVRQGEGNFQRRSEPIMVPRTDISGVPNSENLDRNVWLWSMSDFSGGEGRLVFDRSDPTGPPSYKQTDGGIDTRTRGQFSLQPLPSLATGSGTSTTVQGSAMTNVTGTTSTGTNREYDATNDDAHSGNRTPGAVGASVTFRLVDINIGTGGSAALTVRFRIRNTTDGTNTDVTRNLKTLLGGGTTAGTWTESMSFTGIAGKNYNYHVTTTAATDSNLEVDYLTEETGGTINDPRALFHGRGDNIVAIHWDGTNSDIFKWNFSTSAWDALHANARASQIRAYASTYSNDYFAYDDETVWKSDGTTHSQYLAAAPANTDAWALAVANNRLYYLTFGAARYLHECTLDGAPGAGGYAENGADYKRVMTLADFPNDQSLDNTYRQRMTSIGNGVRFFTNSPGGPTSVFEFSEGAGRPLPFTLPQGYRATAIHHYMGTTFLGVTFQNQAASPAQTRSAVYYIGADLVPRFMAYLREHDPDDEPIRTITSYENDVYFLQGTNVWRYSGSNQSLVLDRATSASDEAAARGLAVMDRKQWIAYAGQGVFVTQNAYPTDNTMYLYSPIWDYDCPDSDKVLLSFDVLTKPLPANTTVTVEYQMDEVGSWTSAGTMSTDLDTKERFTVSTSSSTSKFRVLQWRVGLASSDGVSTPTVRAVTARALVLDYREVFDMVLDISNDTSTNHLSGQQLSGRAKAELLKTYKDNKNLLAFEDHYSSERPGAKDSYTVVLEQVDLDLNDEGEGVARVRAISVA